MRATLTWVTPSDLWRHWLIPIINWSNYTTLHQLLSFLWSFFLGAESRIMNQKMKNEFWQISWFYHEDKILSYKMVKFFPDRSIGASRIDFGRFGYLSSKFVDVARFSFFPVSGFRISVLKCMKTQDKAVNIIHYAYLGGSDWLRNR